MNLENYHWDRFYLHLYYHAQVDLVFKYWTTPNGQESFFVRKCNVFRDGRAIDKNSVFQVGDEYEYLWEDNGKSKGEILKINHEGYVFIFSFDGAKVRITLKEKPLGVLLELKQYDIPEDRQMAHQLDCRSGWTHFLVNLKSLIEKNSDIREENPECGGTLGWGIYPPDGLVLD